MGRGYGYEYKHYYSQKVKDVLLEQINSFPKRVQDEIIQRMYQVAFNAVFNSNIEKCESPIEQIMAVAISDNIDRWMERFYPLWISFTAQEEIEIGSNKYRVDFLIDINFYNDSHIKIAVECDGHEFHEKTKEQAQRDKSRDRDLQAHGITVLRFTGSEIYNDTCSCIHDIERVMGRLINEAMEQRYGRN